MNAMGHQLRNFIGLRQQALSKALAHAAPTAMAMGTDGMAMMGEMAMPLPANTLPMMTGTGPFGPIEMGGMFTVMKVRADLAPGDYRDPGWYQHPPRTVAYEVDAAGASAEQKPSTAGSPGKNMPGMDMPGLDMPGMNHHH
jgi:hypothetical protein